MRVTFLWVGKTRDRSVESLLGHYLGALRKFALVEVAVARPATGRPAAEGKLREGADLLRILAKAGDRGFRVALDARGREYGSEELATALDRWMEKGGSRVVFVVGGEEGLSREVLEAAHERLSLSRLTLPHELARVVLAEQVYRAFSILKGTSYHR